MNDKIRNARIRIFRMRIRRWAVNNCRELPWRRKGEPLYRLVTVELLLQRTKAETVAAAYDSFFSEFPDWVNLAECDEQRLMQSLKPLGLWRRRAEILIAYARAVCSLGGRLPRSRSKLEQIPGVGQYVASAALLFMGISREPLLDAGMARVLDRFFGPRRLVDIRFDTDLQALARRVVDAEDSVLLNWAILDLSAQICRIRSPKCCDCCLASVCRENFIRTDIAT